MTIEREWCEHANGLPTEGEAQTEVGDGANFAGDLLLCVVPETGQEVDDEIDGAFAGLPREKTGRHEASLHVMKNAKLTGRDGRRGSTFDESRRA